MTDLAIRFSDAGGDLVLQQGDLALDEGLQAAVTVSLYSDRRASEAELARLGLQNPRGCWWDLEGARWGSKLWLLTREKQLEVVRTRAEEYALEALRWMQTAGIASRIQATATWVAQGILQLVISMERGSSRRWDHLWRGLTIWEGQFGGFDPGGGGPVTYQLNYGSALAPSGTALDFGSAVAPSGPALDLGGA